MKSPAAVRTAAAVKTKLFERAAEIGRSLANLNISHLQKCNPKIQLPARLEWAGQAKIKRRTPSAP
jgi:hypothetical protein